MKGFITLDVPLGLGLVLHSFYLKEHSENKISKNGNSNVLFVGNIDYKPDMTLQQIDDFLREIFGIFGEIETISVSEFDISPQRNSRFAHITFKNKSSVTSALLINRDDSLLSDMTKVIETKFGINKKIFPLSSSAIYQKSKYSFGKKIYSI